VILTVHNGSGRRGKPLVEATNNEEDCHKASKKPPETKTHAPKWLFMISKNREVNRENKSGYA